jgi:general secretion pathway protein H
MANPVVKVPTPISAPGCSEARPPRAGTGALARAGGKTSGFTLLELLIVIVLAGIVLSMVSISVAPDPAQALGREGARIGQLVAIASDESRIRQQPIYWEADLKGYRWVTEVNGERQLLTDDDLLTERDWDRPLTRIAIDDASGRPTQALLGPGAPAVQVAVAREWVQPRWRLELSNDLASTTIDFDETGHGTVASTQALAH